MRSSASQTYSPIPLFPHSLNILPYCLTALLPYCPIALLPYCLNRLPYSRRFLFIQLNQGMAGRLGCSFKSFLSKLHRLVTQIKAI
ncbi:hypothetical protein F9L02_05540 [Brucella intermedia]|nr:hypothetical protein F9L02_05540 [Brucella intermedia]